MKNKTASGWIWRAGITLLSLLLASGAWAGDVGKLAEDCANCHGKDGASTESEIPIIAGNSATYISDSLTAYQKEKRPCPKTKYREGDKKGQETSMCELVKDLSSADIDHLAEHFEDRKFVRARQKFDPSLAAQGKKIHERKCEKCHTDGGSEAEDESGILAGQWMPYLRASFKEYRSGDRPMPKKMKPRINKLDDTQIEALISYYGSFK